MTRPATTHTTGRASMRRGPHPTRRRLASAVAAVVGVLAVVTSGPAGASASRPASPPSTASSPPSAEPSRPVADPSDPIVLAHYYIWFDAGSWNRAKQDLPAIGRYSSDQISVLRRHVELAKAAGIDGFIVSWKNTERLNARLQTLVEIAEELDFGLAITYQGLDFNREPLPVTQVGTDLDVFIERFATRPPFHLLGRPLVVWTGTWELDARAISATTSERRNRLLILASAKDVADYERVADFVDGDLYYWSSVDPLQQRNHAEKLLAIGNAVRDHGGIWIAPAAPGFDATLLGGRRTVDRRDGETLRSSWNAAAASIPDAIGVISWNEFSENTHIEPSERYGSTSLQTVAALTGSTLPASSIFDSEAADATTAGKGFGQLAAILALLAIVTAATAILARRRSLHGVTTEDHDVGHVG